MKSYLIALSIAALGTNCASAQRDILGVWEMVDDHTGVVKSHVEMYEYQGKVFGKIILLTPSAVTRSCDNCTDYRRGKSLVGMIVIENLEYRNGYWQNGRVLYPKFGKWYDMEAWLKPGDPNTLVLRGYWGLVYRTQYWRRLP